MKNRNNLNLKQEIERLDTRVKVNIARLAVGERIILRRISSKVRLSWVLGFCFASGILTGYLSRIRGMGKILIKLPLWVFSLLKLMKL